MESSPRPQGRRAGTKAPRSASASKNALKTPASAFVHTIQQELLTTISTAVENGQLPDEVAQLCLQVFLGLTDARAAAVFLQDEETQQLRMAAVCGPLEGKLLETCRLIVDRVVAQGQLAAEGDLIALPLNRKNRIEGVLIVLGLPTDKAEGEAVSDLLNFVASRLASGVDHSRLAQKYAHKIVRLQHLEEVTEILNSTLEEEDILQRAIEAAVRLMDAEAGALLLVDPERGDLFFQATVGEKGQKLKALRLPLGHGIAGLVAQTGKPLMVNNAPSDPRVAHEVDRYTGFTTKTLLCVPVRARNRTLGVMEAIHKRGGKPFGNWDLMEFLSMSHQIAIALENSRLLRNYSQKIGRLQKLQEISAVLNSTLNQAEVRKRAIEAATALMEAETGSLLLLDESAGELYFDVALGEKGEGVRQIRLKLGQGIAGHVAQTGQPVIINDVQSDPRFAREADKKTGFVTRNMVCVPVKAHGKLLGVLQAINKLNGGLFNDADQQDLISLGNQVGIAIENANLYEEISRLLEGFISASVVAIESRDPSTSGHSQRVATLSCGLAEMLERVEHGPYAGLQFTPDQMKEMRYAAVLHDFGKVGVREHVLVKANKLLPGDLALLKARFDFIKRTWEVRSLRRKVEILMSGDRQSTAALLAEVDEELARRIGETDGLLEFLLSCNKPTVLEKGGFERLNEIARMTYHSFEGVRPYLSAEEVLTLSIPRGSLTDVERREIESHVTHTYRFLSAIPWSKSLSNIPMIAYGHHEKLDGSGYPRQVASETISIQTRMMTISDIYDALTASDRPYKKAVPTSVALDILQAEQKAGKLDRELLEIFIDARVYLRVHS